MSINTFLLKKAAMEGKLAHFLLFHGSGTRERYEDAMELAAILNCTSEAPPCRVCTACKKIQTQNHPDMHVIKPFKTSVGIDQIIALQGKIYRKIYEGKYRVCLIEEADKLTLPAANALLKIAEEPPANTVIILSTANKEAIIQTLQSRAQAIYCIAPSEDSWGEGKNLYQLSGGDPDLARKISEYGQEKVERWLEIYHSAIRTSDFLLLFALFPMEREEALVFLQVLIVSVKNQIIKGEESPLMLKEISSGIEAVKRQANHRLALEVLALKHMKLGGTKIG